jgi:tetratricopeptide (TPR) repeat protein
MRTPSSRAATPRRALGVVLASVCVVALGVGAIMQRSAAPAIVDIQATIGPTLLPAVFASQRQWNEAERRAADIALYERRVQEDPQSASDWTMLAAHRLQAARDAQSPDIYRAAEDAARRSLALRTDRNAKTMMLLSSALLAQHRFPEALAWADSMVRADSSVLSFRALRFELQVEMGHYDAADTTRRTLLLDRLHPAVAPRLARWFELRGQPDSARHLLLAAREIADTAASMPEEQRGWFHLRVADFALRNGDLALAGDALRRGRSAVPADVRLALATVRWHGLRGDSARTRALADSLGVSLDIATSAFMAAFERAHGNRLAMARWLERVEQLNAESPEPFARGWTLARLDEGVRMADTRALLEREALVRNDIYGWDQLALARLATGDVAGARVASERALRLGTRDGNLWWHAARVAEAAGEQDRAKTLAATALEINPMFHVADAALARAMVARGQ